MLDNHIYGMTGGQLAPTTPFHSHTQTSPHGNPEFPFDACKVAIAAGATYVARWTCAHPRELAKAIREGIMHKGFSFIQAVSQCPTQAGRYIYGIGDPAEMVNMLRQKSVRFSAAEKMSPEELEGKVTVGKLYEEKGKPELSESIYAMMKGRKG
jgi:2-oxoglutarate ferredoxin oxidoreductase subunit beta